MNIKEIINRSELEPISMSEGCFIINEHIKDVKGIDVKAFIEVRKGMLKIVSETNSYLKMLPISIAYFKEKLS